MASTITNPIAAAAFPVFKSRECQDPTKFFATKLEFGGDFLCRKYVSWNICGRKQRIMKGFNWVCASTGDEGFPDFEHEKEPLNFADGGLEATVNNLSKWLIISTFIGINMWRHDAEALWAVLGAGVNGMISMALKQILNHERPNSTVRSDPGMPSTHAQSVTYTTMFIVLSIVELYGANALTTTLSGMLIILGSYFAWLRVSQNLHTVSQVVVGAIIGSSFSFLWLWSWKAYVLNLFVCILWVRVLIIVATTGFVLNYLNYIYHSWM